MEVDPNNFINDEWRDCLVRQWPITEPDDNGEAKVNMQLRVLDPIDLLDDVRMYVRGIYEYYQELTTDDQGNSSTPAGELRQAFELLDDAFTYLADPG